MIDLKEEFKNRTFLSRYARLMKLVDTRLDDIKKNPEKHIDCLCQEVARLRSYLDSISHAVFPLATFTEAGTTIYPEHIDIGAQAVSRLNKVESILFKYENSEPIRPDPDPDPDPVVNVTVAAQTALHSEYLEGPGQPLTMYTKDEAKE